MQMFSYSVTQWIFFFYLYCFLGWCFESCYVSLKSRRWVNRGFMRGPFLPIYGSGAIMMLVVSAPFGDWGFPQKEILTYFAGCIGATILEYVTGAAMEALFKVRYWDYSYQRFNYKGYICLSSSVAWGFFTLLMTEVLHKPIESAVLAIPGSVLSAVTFVLTAGIGADFALAFRAAMDLRDVLIALDKAKEEMAHMQKRLDVLIALTGEEVENQVEKRKEEFEKRKEEFEKHKENLEKNIARYREEFREKRRLNRILLSNPTMISARFGEALRELQEKLDAKLDEKRN